MSNVTGIIIATKTEAKPFIEGLGLSLIEKKPVPIYGNSSTVLALSGIGKSSAAIAATDLADRYPLLRMINLGAAGSTGIKCTIGDIFHIHTVYELDRPRPDDDGPMEHRPDTLEGFPFASLATRDRPVLEEDDRIAAGKYADLFDMEGAAVVQACRALDVEVHLFKIVTDTMECSVKDIIANIVATRNRFYEFYRDRVMPVLPGVD
jgi:nucleoside phosphorylase